MNTQTQNPTTPEHPSPPSETPIRHLLGTPFCPLHKSHLLNWLRCSWGFWHAPAPTKDACPPPWFLIGRLYHSVIEQCTRTALASEAFDRAIAELPSTHKIALPPVALVHARMIAQRYAGLQGRSEVHWLAEIDGLWFSGAWDHTAVHTITDWKTTSIPRPFEADFGIEGTLYRLAYAQLHGSQPTMRWVRLASLWDRRQPCEIATVSPVHRDAVKELLAIARRAIADEPYRRIGAECLHCPIHPCLKGVAT